MADQVQLLVAKIAELEKKTGELDSGKWVIPKKGDTGPLAQRRKERALRVIRLMVDTFNEAELRELCMDFFLDPEDLEGETRKEHIVSFVKHFYNRNTLDVLINWLMGIRPNVKWPEVEGL